MSRRTSRRALLLLVAALACSGGGSAAHDSARTGPASGAPSVAAGPLTPGDSANCPRDGRWRLCSVVKRLQDAGLVPQKQDDPVRHPFFSVPGTAYKVARGDLEVFVYDDEQALRRDLAALDTVRVAPKGETGPWRTPRPTFIHSANLLAVYQSLSETQSERVGLALGAGPPQPTLETTR